MSEDCEDSEIAWEEEEEEEVIDDLDPSNRIDGEVLVIQVKDAESNKNSKKRGVALDSALLSELVSKSKKSRKSTSNEQGKGTSLRYDNKTALQRHQSSLSRSLHQLANLSSMANNDSLFAWVLSIFPDAFTARSSYVPFPSPSHVQGLLAWIQQNFKATDFHSDQIDEEEDEKQHHQSCSMVDRLVSLSKVQSLHNGQKYYNCSCREICVILVALFRLMGVRTRLVCTLDPPSWKGKDHEDLFQLAASQHGLQCASSTRPIEAAEKYTFKSKSRLPSRYWIEIFQPTPDTKPPSSPSSQVVISLLDCDSDSAHEPLGAWIHCDPTANRINHPAFVLEELRRNKAIEYIVACDDDIGNVADVTARYEKSSESTVRARCPAIASWWLMQLVQVSASGTVNKGGSIASSSVAIGRTRRGRGSQTREAEAEAGLHDSKAAQNAQVRPDDALRARIQKQEEEEFNRKKYCQPAPTTLRALKDHLLFVAEDCEEAPMKVHECINPFKAKGQLKGIVQGRKVYPRFVLDECQTRMHWKKALRDVPHDAIPCKILPRKNRDGEMYSSELFGAWQTTAYVLEAVSEGIIPTNSHGNVEVWDGCETLVPGGARYVPCTSTTIESVRKIAMQLELGFKDAIVGFESRGGGRHPRIGGVVVLERDYDILISAVQEIQQEAARVSDEKREAVIVQRWTDLVRSALSRQNLKEIYGH